MTLLLGELLYLIYESKKEGGNMYKIGLFSQITKTTIKTLRYYDKIGLLKPKEIDTFTNYRYYTTDQISDFYEILAYRQAGLSIKQIKEIILDGKKIEDVLIIQKKN